MEQAQQQLDELEWRSPEWINVNGLRTDNVLEYLSESPFWDRQCSNQQLKMQRGGIVPIPTVDPELTRMRGVEYVLLLAREPDLWVVRKQFRSGNGNGDGDSNGNGNGGENTTPLADYYVVGARVYMSPRVGDVLRASCLGIAESLRAVGVDTGDGTTINITDTDTGDTDTTTTNTTAADTADTGDTAAAVLPGSLLKTALASTPLGSIDA
ncbi:hypothetical protein CANINC_003538 [Pichia inconspicua]|uniref:Mediator of RNA polymerase II transcription subunit 6 n=1 Tax=Pichia inconspicua TaxID=52247 RepID=A0A4T0WZI5_9ASCO|nr:hypothetical protein CANINC_003538 [[Candida] inconspicua]